MSKSKSSRKMDRNDVRQAEFMEDSFPHSIIEDSKQATASSIENIEIKILKRKSSEGQKLLYELASMVRDLHKLLKSKYTEIKFEKIPAYCALFKTS